jgi:hypothetical protein
MRMLSGGLKSISAILVCWLTYIDRTFTPLFWVLLALVALDMFLNVHKEGQQFIKIGSMAVTLGAPSYVAANLSNPNLGKYLVAIMCLVYLQLVVPQLITKISSLNFSKDPKQNAVDQEALIALIRKVEALETAKAQAILDPSQASNAPTGSENREPTA